MAHLWGNRNQTSRSGQLTVIAALAVIALCVVATQTALAQTFTVLYNFTGSSDGAYPTAGLVRDGAGNLFGTASAGGPSGYGAVFKVDINGKQTVLYGFNGGTDGATPSSVIRDLHGDLFGTTEEGGGMGCRHDAGCGTVYKIDAGGKESVLYRFTGRRDGASPTGTLFRDRQGKLYGTTEIGGNLSCYPPAGCGTVFSIANAGDETVLRRFNVDDGFIPSAGVIADEAGNLFGTTESGGDPGYGNVFKLSGSGKETVLYHFADPKEGQFPEAGVTFGKDGTLYGTTVQGGAYGYGTVFKLNKKGVETVVYSFSSINGVNPFGGVVLDSKGNLYGSAQMGGPLSYGTVYKLDANGEITLLHVFSGMDGEYPFGNLVRDEKGTLYGTTSQGGAYGYGTVWQLAQ